MKLITVFSLLFVSVLYCQNNKTNNYKYGFIDQRGKEVTLLKYDDAYSFSDQIARVSLKGKWGFINKDGKEITAIKYDTVYDCKSGVARVKLNGKYGLIDTSGKEITEIKYDNIGRFDYGIACVKMNGKWGIIDNKGNELTSLKYDYMQTINTQHILSLRGKNKTTLIDEGGRPIEANPLGYFSDNSRYFDDSGIAKVCLNGKWGFIDKTGKEISAIKYDYVFFFSEGMARVLLNDKWGFIDESGNEVIPLIYDFMDEAYDYRSICGTTMMIKYSDPIYLYKDGKNVDYHTSKFLKEYVYFNHGLLRVYYLNIHFYKQNTIQKHPKYVFLDKNGKEMISTIYDSVADLYYNYGRTKMQFYHDGLRKVEKYENDWKYGFADTLGKVVIPLKYEYASDFKGGQAEVKLDKKYGIINKKGEEVIPLKYNSIYWDDGMFILKDEEGFAVVDNYGKKITPLKYTDIDNFREGYALVCSKDKIGYIDKSGKEVISRKRKKIDWLGPFNGGFAKIYSNKKWGFIDKTGKEITLFKYSEVKNFKNDFARVAKDYHWGFINNKGKEITPLKYDEIYDFEEGLAVVKVLIK